MRVLFVDAQHLAHGGVDIFEGRPFLGREPFELGHQAVEFITDLFLLLLQFLYSRDEPGMRLRDLRHALRRRRRAQLGAGEAQPVQEQGGDHGLPGVGRVVAPGAVQAWLLLVEGDQTDRPVQRLVLELTAHLVFWRPQEGARREMGPE